MLARLREVCLSQRADGKRFAFAWVELSQLPPDLFPVA